MSRSTIQVRLLFPTSAPASPPGPPQPSASAPAADHFQTAQSPPGPTTIHCLLATRIEIPILLPLRQHADKAPQALTRLQAVVDAGGNTFAELMDTVRCTKRAIMPAKRRHWSGWNYYVHYDPDNNPRSLTTYHMNTLEKVSPTVTYPAIRRRVHLAGAPRESDHQRSAGAQDPARRQQAVTSLRGGSSSFEESQPRVWVATRWCSNRSASDVAID